MWSRFFRTRQAWLVGFLGLLCIVPLLSAQEDDDDEEDDGAWKAERTKLQQVIDARVEAEVNKNVTKNDIIKQLKWRPPITPPKKTKEAIVEEAEKRIEADAQKRFPDAERLKFAKEAAEKYQIYKVGEDISFTIRGGVGTNTNVSGKLYQITDLRIRVGDRWIVRSDLDDETAAHFFPEVAEQFIKRYIRVQNIRYDGKVDAFKADLRKERIPKLFTSSGYIVKPSVSPNSIKPDDWVAKSDVVDYLFNRQRTAYENKIRRQITEEVFAANGFLYVAEQNEWMPKKQAESVRERLRRILEEKREKEEEAKKPANDPWGGEPGMNDPGMMPEGPPP